MSTKETTAVKRGGNEAETSAYSPSGNAMAKLDLSDEQWDAIPESVQIKIVRAVNAHDELVSALKAIAAALKQPVQNTGLADDVGSLRAQVRILRGDCEYALETANRAIAKAEVAV